MGNTVRPPIYRLFAWFAYRGTLCPECHDGPKREKFHGFCSEECVTDANYRQGT